MEISTSRRGILEGCEVHGVLYLNITNEICIVFKCTYTESEVRLNYFILTNFIIFRNNILFYSIIFLVARNLCDNYLKPWRHI